MIIVEIAGGLGNQMFQYALGRYLAIKNDDVLKLEMSYFNKTNARPFCLQFFNTNLLFATEKDVLGANSKCFKKWIWYLLGWLNGKEILQVNERQFNFDPNILNMKGNIFLRGYWQTEKYFKSIENIIRKEFMLSVPIGIETKIKKKKIREQRHTVSLHIRRGDYVTDLGANKISGVLPLNYYYSAIKFLEKRTKELNFFIFSDDIQWVRHNLKITYPVIYVSHNDEVHAYEDMYLMSLCDYHIIANSTFSWWGSWLDNKSDKIVIAPKKWFKDKTKNVEDIIPSSWIKL